MSFKPALLLAGVLALAATGAYAAEHIVSYDPADAKTRALVDNGLTFVYEKRLGKFQVREVLATQARASAKLEPANERELGERLSRLLPADAGQRYLYRISNEGQGAGMVRAFCPGSDKGWLAFSPLAPRRNTVVQVLGNDPAGGGKARLCASLSFLYRGEWALPPGDPRAPAAPPGPGGRQTGS